MTQIVQKQDLIYPELSYQVIGCAFDVFNEIGGGLKEVYYQRALKIAFTSKGLRFQEQVYFPVTFTNIVVGRNFFDFFVEDKIVVEIKSLARFTKANYDQVLNYLDISKIKLALLINFGSEEVRCKRVVNFKALHSNG